MLDWLRSKLAGAGSHDAAALCRLAAEAADAGRAEEALEWARRAVAADPAAAAPRYALGRAWEAASRYVEAEASYREAVIRDPGHARAHNNLGCMLHMQGKLDAALACYRKAIELDPTLPEANRNYAAIAEDPGAREVAIAGFLRQLASHPDDGAAFYQLATLYAQAGRYDEALASLERAVAIHPGHAEAHFARGHLLLLLGDYARGWPEYEWRWKIPAFNAPARRFPQAMWDGRAVEGTILLHGETGLGDMLQFVRYAPLVAERCEGVAVECPAPLKSLLERVDGITQVVAQGEPSPPFEAHVPVARLPFLFRTTLDTIPWGGPYVRPDPARVASWRERVRDTAGARAKVGLAWAGNPAHNNDRRRSARLAALAPLARTGDIAFFSLQKGEAAREAAAAPAGMHLIDVGPQLRDFDDTAALASLLDVIVSVDTSVSHLGGALGARTWVLVAASPDWRNHLARDDNPWYPSMRLFRQERDGDWAGVAERVAGALRAVV
jgi:Tfp pilus assembly protein PilF